MRTKIDSKILLKIYIVVYALIMIIVAFCHPVDTMGEFDDYSLPAVSIIYERNVGVAESDLITAKEIFPEWAAKLDEYGLSGYYNNSGEMSWYFPTYSVAVVPFLFLFIVLPVSATYAFPIANIVYFVIALFILEKYLDADVKKKWLLVLALSINPIIFYYGWPSAEAFLTALMVVAMVFWSNGWDKRAGLAIAIAGTLNATILVFGIVMIAKYLIRMFKDYKKGENFLHFFKRKIGDALCLALCYVIGIVPMLYNYYYAGCFNLTASYATFTVSEASTFDRFVSYIFDLNYGLVPYYPVFFVLAIVFFVMAILKRNVKFLEWIIAFFACVYLYSIMTFVDCTMSGVCRYTVWAAPALIFAIILQGGELWSDFDKKAAGKILVGIEVLWSVVLIGWYGINHADTFTHQEFAPIARIALDKTPAIYNPLYSTFVYRNNNEFVYSDSDGYVKKILVQNENQDGHITGAMNAAELSNYVSANEDAMIWLQNAVNEKSQKGGYVNVPSKYNVKKRFYENTFSSVINVNTAYEYLSTDGIVGADDQGAWVSLDGVSVKVENKSTNKLLQVKGATLGDVQIIICCGEDIIEQRKASGMVDEKFYIPATIDLNRVVIKTEKFEESDATTAGLGLYLQEISVFEELNEKD